MYKAEYTPEVEALDKNQGKSDYPRYHPEVKADMVALDKGQRETVQRAVIKTELHPKEYGKALGNKHGMNLTGLRRVKIRSLGIRVVYQVISDEEGSEHVFVVAVGKREDDEVYRKAFRRYHKP